MRSIAPIVLAVLAAFSSATIAAAYPDRPMRYIIASAPGGGPDTSARVIMAELSRVIGQHVIVENRPGAGGSIGTELISKSSPDGYTMGHGNINTMAIARSVLSRLPYDPDRDLQPVVQMYETPNLLAVTLGLPVKSVAELIEHARKHPGDLIYASTGNGSSVHVGMELFKLLTATQMVHVPYKAATVAITDLTSGRVQVMADNINSIGTHVKAARLRGLAVTSGYRVPAFSDLPTVIEAGVPGYAVTAWAGVIMPVGVPKPLVSQLNVHMNKALASSTVKEKLAEQGCIVIGGTTEQYAEHIRREAARWAEVVKKSGAKVD